MQLACATVKYGALRLSSRRGISHTPFGVAKQRDQQQVHQRQVKTLYTAGTCLQWPTGVPLQISTGNIDIDVDGLQG